MKSKREKQILYINTHIYKNGTNEPVCKAEIQTQMQRTEVWTSRGKRGGGINWEFETDIYTLLCIKWKTESLLG